jgi:hypothetical protein
MKKKYIASQLHYRERRHYSRVTFDRTAWLKAHGKRQQFDKTRNLSMGGVCIQGQSKFNTGDICDFELHDEGRHSCRVVKFCARVIRSKDDSLALQFVDMDVDSYNYLQTMVLYHAEDPLEVATEFKDSFQSSSYTAFC